MKTIKITLIVISQLALISCNDDTKESTKKYSEISFTRNKIDIGEVKLGTSKEVIFYAKNRSDAPLIIDSVKSSCSCTVSKFPKHPILKNDSGIIIAKYTPNATNVGTLSKSVVVLSNTKPAFNVLTFYGNVIP